MLLNSNTTVKKKVTSKSLFIQNMKNVSKQKNVLKVLKVKSLIMQGEPCQCYIFIYHVDLLLLTH